MRKLSLLPLILFTLFYILLNFYAIGGLHLLFPKTWFSSFFWVFSIGLAGALILAIVQFRKKRVAKFFTIVTHAFLMFFLAEMVFSTFLLLGDILGSFVALSEKFSSGQFHFERNYYWVCFCLVMLLLTVIVFGYGIVKGKYAYRVIKHTLYFDDLPQNFDGFTITQISDVHAGSFTKPKEVKKGIDLINKQKSDLFVFTGDLVNNVATEIEPYIDMFSELSADYGKYSILGNHDYGDYSKWPSPEAKTTNFARLKENHAALGFRLLLDEHITLTRGTDKIILAGIENWGIGFGERGDLKKALQGTDPTDFKILLSHDPSHWDAEVKNFPSNIALTLAGHTHGMQFGIEAFGIKWSPVKYRYKHWAGVKEENNRYLNINRGFGFLGFSGRIGIWPEITVVTLRKK
ncbi:MAG: metallophosphoesterase [Pedobacter sp.]|nr:metallophosphoesterase [Pedobacter sp.]